MEPGQMSYQQQQSAGQPPPSTRPSLRLDAMRERGPPVYDDMSIGARPIRASRNRTISESAVTGGSLLINHPMKFSGNKLVHLPPQLVQTGGGGAPAVASGGGGGGGAGQITPTSERRETGNLMSHHQRQQQQQQMNTLQFGSAPVHSGAAFSRMFQNDRHSPSMESPDGGRRYGDSPRSNSYNQNELDDLIIDEILSLENEQQRHDGQRPKTQPLSVSYSCADNLTQLSGASNARPIPGTNSSGGSGHSGSPNGIGGGFPIPGADFRQVVSSSAPTSSLDMDSVVRGGSGGDGEDMFRDRRKKDIHNMIERRRRYNINDRIKELGLMLPKHSQEDMKLNKGTILKASCDYIRQLQKDKEVMFKQTQAAQQVEAVAKQYADRVRELEEQLARNGLSVPPAHLPQLPTLPQPPIGRQIKSEPHEDSPNHTPCGSLQSSSGFMSQLSDTTAAMAIASPMQRGHMQHQQDSSYFSVGSASPPDHMQLHAAAQQQQRWREMHHPSQPFPDLMMEEMHGAMQGNPLLQGDPLISQAGPSPHLAASQMSPDIQWDQAGFSPDGAQQQHMDYSN